MSSAANDLEIYERESAGWWEPGNHFFRSLRAVQEGRVELITSWLGTISGSTIVDVGCGGGFLAAPLHARGARIVGIDISPASLRIARQKTGGNCLYLCADCNALPLGDESADHVLLSDILDHTETWPNVLREAARVLRPGGFCYASTLNRTWQSRYLGVEFAERVGLIPRGTHDPRMFITPDELTAAAREVGLTRKYLQGESVEVWKTLTTFAIHLRPSSQTSLSYCMLLEKAGKKAR